MKKKNLKTLAACLCLSCTLLTGTLPTQAAARTSVSQTAKSSFTVTNKKTHSGKGQASSSSSGTWKTIKGRHYYYNARGKKVKGKVKIGSRYYFFDKNGIQRYGWKKIKNDYYFFRISTGTTGAYMLTSTTINGIALDASGRASKSGSNLRKLKLMTEANKIVEKISRPGMNKMQRLRASFDYVKKQYTYYCWREFRYRTGKRISPKICFSAADEVTVFPMQQLSPPRKRCRHEKSLCNLLRRSRLG